MFKKKWRVASGKWLARSYDEREMMNNESGIVAPSFIIHHSAFSISVASH